MEKRWSKSWKSASQKRKQRKFLFNAPMHVKHKFMNSHLSAELKKEYNIRSLPVRKGDTVKILKGDHKGKSGKITKVSLSRRKVYIEGIETTKTDGSKVLYPIHPSNISITKLDLSDGKRVEKIERMKKQNGK